MSKDYCPSTFTDTCEFMKQLAAMANMDYAGIRRMVLVLDVDNVPVLYVESFLDRNRVGSSELHKVDLNVVKGPIEIRDTTSMQNDLFKTYVSLEQQPMKEPGELQ